MLDATPGVPPVVADYLSVIFDKASGEIVHLHRTTVLRGGDDPSPSHRAEAAHAALNAMAGNRRLPEVELAEVDPKTFREGMVHRFDLRTRALVATPRR